MITRRVIVLRNVIFNELAILYLSNKQMHWNNKNNRKDTNLVASYKSNFTINNKQTMLVLTLLLLLSQLVLELLTNKDFILVEIATKVKN